MSPERGEVWLVDLGMPAGYEQAGERPAVIVQHDDLNALSTMVVIPLTTASRPLQRGVVALPSGKGGLAEKSNALCYQIRAVDKYRLKKRLGKLPQAELLEIETTLAYVLGLAI